MNNKRYIVIESTKYIGKFSVYDIVSKEEIPCHNLATARSICKEKNHQNHLNDACEVCECDPCDCYDGCKPIDSEHEYWKMWGDK